jgi:lysophospholipase L1-like esterase
MKLGTAYRTIVLTGLLFPSLLTGHATGSQPEPKSAASSTQTTAASSTPAHPNDYRSQHEQLLLTDFPWLARFKDEDMKLGAPAAGEDRVVFMGDSITEGWHLDTSFPGKPYVNRGISGQTTPQMVLRFHQDVISLKPKVVIILAGINDIAGNTGPMTLEQTENNLAAMTEMASANGIRVVLCSVLPAYDFPWSPGLEPAPKVVALNAWIESFAAKKHLIYVDYYAPMKDDRGGLPPTLSRDGVHPLPAGYAIMAPLAEAAIEKALK